MSIFNNGFNPLAGNYEVETLLCDCLVFPADTFCFNPLAGNYEVETSAKAASKFLSLVARVSIPLRGIMKSKHQMSKGKKRRSKRFNPLAGNYEVETLSVISLSRFFPIIGFNPLAGNYEVETWLTN